MAVLIWSGLVLGAIYALIATGFTVAQLPTGVFNFAQGAITTGGCLLAYEWLAAEHTALWWAILANVVIGAALGALCELLAVRPLRWAGGAVGSNAIVTTVGASTALIGAFGLRWGYQPLLVPFRGPQSTIHLLGAPEQPVEVIVVCAAIVAAVGFEAWFRRSRRGQACLAVAENREAATLRGVNVSALSLSAFVVSGAFGGVIGLIVGPITYAYPSLAATLALGGFVAIALGGEGSFIGGLLGGFLVGLASTFATRYIGANYSNLSILVLLLLTLAIRPAGLSGLSRARNV
jgi:branched-chain amino acid transport system permease protein